MKTVPLSREFLEERGWVVEKVEKFNHYTRRLYDAFGFGDLLAMHPQRGIIALVQATSLKEFRDHRDRILDEPKSEQWKLSGGVIILHGWTRVNRRIAVREEIYAGKKTHRRFVFTTGADVDSGVRLQQVPQPRRHGARLQVRSKGSPRRRDK